jgi:hypothetical protein
MERRSFLKGLLIVPSLWVPPVRQILADDLPPMESLYRIAAADRKTAEAGNYIDPRRWPLMDIRLESSDSLDLYVQYVDSAISYIGSVQSYFGEKMLLINNIQTPMFPFRLLAQPAAGSAAREGGVGNRAWVQFRTIGVADGDEYRGVTTMIVGPAVESRIYRLS